MFFEIEPGMGIDQKRLKEGNTCRMLGNVVFMSFHLIPQDR